MKLTNILLIGTVAGAGAGEIPSSVGIEGWVECEGNKITYSIGEYSGEYLLPDSVELYSAQSWIDLNGNGLEDCMIMDEDGLQYFLPNEGYKLGEPRKLN